MDDDRLARLTEGQRACLRMVLLHMSSKDIARALDISPHTVDQRIKLAMKTLRASSRVEAARALALLEGDDRPQSLVYQRPDIDPFRGDHSLAASALEGQRRGADDAGSAASDAAQAGTASSLPPLLGKGREHDRTRRIAWIVLILAAVAVGFAALFTGLNALSEFTR